MADDEESLRRMVLGFCMSQLQELMAFVGRNKAGRLEDLRRSALHLLQSNSLPVKMKIRELHSLRVRQERFPIRQPPPGPNRISPAPLMVSTYHRPSAPSAPATGAYIPGLSYNAPPPSTYVGNIPRFYIPSFSRNGLPPSCNGALSPTYGNTSRPSRAALSSRAAPPSSYGNFIQFYSLQPPVKFKQFPFYEVLAELLQPVVTAPTVNLQCHEVKYKFELTPDQANYIKTSKCAEGNADQAQIHLRCCFADTSSEQYDNFPLNIWVNVNGNPCLLPKPVVVPGAGARRPSQPIDITPLVILSPFSSTSHSSSNVLNQLFVKWETSDMTSYAVAVYLVRKLTAEHLMDKLKFKGIRHQDYTKTMIKEKLKEGAGSGITTINLRVSLLCPLGKRRMEFPCRAFDCTHPQCFDAFSYIRMNLLNPTWNCPVCNRPAPFESLYGDGLFHSILQVVEEDRTEILFLADGSWEVVQQAASGGPDVVTVDSTTNEDLELQKFIKIEDDD